MKVLLYGRFGKYPREIEELVHSCQFQQIPINSQLTPDVVITYGGDGTVLGAERDYPEVPKLVLKNSEICHLCSTVSNEELLKRLAKNQLKIRPYLKLETKMGNKKIVALNDIIIAHKFPNIAIRFAVNNGPILIGDGAVFSTPFGSTGYFYSITKSIFKRGIGLATNNIHNQKINHKIFSENAVVKIKILRGPAVVAVDNDPNILDLTEGQEITIQKSSQVAKFFSPN